jgi:hypothetical protein
MIVFLRGEMVKKKKRGGGDKMKELREEKCTQTIILVHPFNYVLRQVLTL